MIRFKNITKKFNDDCIAINNLNLEINKGELFVLIGPSGCGKTTTMRMINRLIDPTEGEIYINNILVQEQDPVELRRDIGYVIQQIGLFPHMTIRQNVGLVPKLKKMNPSEIDIKVNELLEMVNLDPDIYRDRYPKELSGGQQQRIGVVRALAADPNIILMDEPFSALDPISREQLQDELIDLKEKINKTIIFVTHDIDEAIKIADRICIMRDGKIVQVDTPEKILRHPNCEFVKNFIGENRLSQQAQLPPLREAIDKAITARSTKGLAESIKIMRKNRIDKLIVVDQNNKYLGIASAWDIHSNFANEFLTLQDILTSNFPTIFIDENCETALKLISTSELSYLPVIDKLGKFHGIITKGSLLQVLTDEFLYI